MKNFTQFASTNTYDCNSYGAGNYNTCDGSSGLSYTGSNIFVPLAIGAVLIIGAAALLLRRFFRSSKRKSYQE